VLILLFGFVEVLKFRKNCLLLLLLEWEKRKLSLEFESHLKLQPRQTMSFKAVPCVGKAANRSYSSVGGFSPS
jgi:hypothetical protein